MLAAPDPNYYAAKLVPDDKTAAVSFMHGKDSTFTFSQVSTAGAGALSALPNTDDATGVAPWLQP